MAMPAAALAAAIKVNFAARAGGSLCVVLLNAETGTALKRSVPLTGDELEAAVVWHNEEKGGAGAAMNGAFRIEFVLTGDVELYSFLVE